MRRLLIALLLLLFVGLGGTWIRWGKPRAETFLRSKIESVLRDKLGRPVELQSVRIHPFLLAVRLENLKVTSGPSPNDPPLFLCRQWTLFPTSIRFKKSFPFAAFSLGKSHVELPIFRGDLLKDSGRRSSLPTLLTALPSHRLDWSGGSFHIPGKDALPAFALVDSKGTALLTSDDFSLDLEGQTPWGPLTLAGRLAQPVTFLNPGEPRWKATIFFPSSRLEDLQPLLPSSLPGRGNGTVSLLAAVEGDVASFTLKKWSVDVTFQQAGWNFDRLPWDLSGNVRITPEKIESSGLTLGPLRLSGRLTSPGHDPQADLVLKGESFPLRDLRKRLPWKPLSSLPWKGTGSVEASFRGPLCRPVATVSFSGTDAGAGPIVFPSVTGTLASGDAGAAADIRFAQGRLHAEARPCEGSRRAFSEWTGFIQDVSLDELARAGNWGRVGGTLNADFALQRSTATGQPAASGLLRVEDPAWGETSLKEPLVAYFSWRDDVVHLHNKSDTFDFTWTWDGRGDVSSHLAFSRGDGFSILGRGSLTGPQRALFLEVALKQGSARDLPFLLERYPEIQGAWSANVSGTGFLKNPVIKTTLKGGGLQLRKASLLHAFEGEGEWTKETFRLNSFSLDGVWTATGSHSNDRGWSGRLSVDGGDSSLFSEIFLSSPTMTGPLTGVCRFEGVGDASVGELRLTSPRGIRQGDLTFGESSLWLTWTPEEIRLQNLTLGRSPRPIELAGVAVPRKRGEWDLSLTGSWIERGEGKLIVSPNRVSLRHFQMGDGITLDGSFARDTQFLESSIVIDRTPIAALARRFGEADLPLPQGDLDGLLHLAGHWKNPSATLRISSPHTRWQGIEGSAELEGAWSLGLPLTVRTALIRAGKGNVTVQGEIPLRASDLFVLSFDARDFPFPSEPLTVEGSWSGKGLLKGSLSNPEGEFQLETTPIRIGSLPPFSTTLSARLIGNVVTVQTWEALTSEGKVTLDPGSRCEIAEGGLIFDVRSELRNVHAGPISLFGGLRFSGDWRWRRPGWLRATLTAEDLWVNQQLFNQELTRIAWAEQRLEFAPAQGRGQRFSGAIDLTRWPRVRFDNVSLWNEKDRLLHLDGEAGPEGPFSFFIEGHALESSALLSLANINVSADGLLDISLTGKGEGKTPLLEAEIVGVDGALEGVPYDRLEANLSWARGRLKLNRLNLTRRKGYTLEGKGEYVASRNPNRPAQSSFLFNLSEGNLSILEALWPSCRKAHGSFSGTLSIQPGSEGPLTSGVFVLRNGALKSDQYLRQVSDLSVHLTFDRNKIRVDHFTGRAGKGQFSIEGNIGIEGGSLSEYDLVLRTLGDRGIPVVIPQLAVPPGPLLKRFSFFRHTLQAASRGEPRLDLTIRGPRGAQVIAGEIVLENTHATYPPTPGAFGRKRTWLREFWNDTVWDVRLVTGKETWFQNEYVNVKVDGGLSIQGPRDGMVVDGRLTSDRGLINYLSQPFNLKRAQFEVITDTRPAISDGPIQAYLSGEAERNATTIDGRGVASLDVITMLIPRARLGEIQPRFISRNNPGLTSERVFQKMLGFSSRDPLQTPTVEDQDQLFRAGLIQLVGASAGPFANRLAQVFGIDMISTIYEPTTTEGEGPLRRGPPVGTGEGTPAPGQSRWSDLLRGAGATAGVRLTNRIFGVYKFKVDRTAQNRVYLHDEVQVLGRLSGSLYLKFVSELDTRTFLGQPPNRQILLERQWKFGFPRRKERKQPLPETTE